MLNQTIEKRGFKIISAVHAEEKRRAKRTIWKEGARNHVTDRIGNIAAQTPTIQTFAYPSAP